jgi:PleD family two-component response regulator
VGVATLDPNTDREGFDSATLMRAADAAMYEAKQSGRDRVVVASPAKNSGGLERATPH